MSNSFNLFVRGFKGNTMTIDIHKDALIGDLFRKLKDKTGIPVNEIQLNYCSKTIDYKHHKNEHLAFFNIENHSNLYMVMRLLGGSKVLDDDVELTDLPDMITCEDDTENKRAKMPCGHAIGPESLTSYCRSLLDNGKYRFMCPWIDPNNSRVGCPAEWSYVIVRRLAVLTESEKRVFEKLISQNYLRRGENIQECPGCQSFCLRQSNKDRRVVCRVCSADSGAAFEFCWYCLGKWKNAGTTKCGNVECSGKDPRLAILQRATLKEIVGVSGVPSRRACPKCGMIIEHVKNCKHMTCICSHEFCFICLKAKSNRVWQCGAFNSPCAVAPKQLTLPN